MQHNYHQKLVLTFIFLFLPYLLTWQHVYSQKIDPDFPGVLKKAYSQVNAIVIQEDGKVIIGGYFSIADNRPTKLFRMNTDGTMDDSFKTPIVPISLNITSNQGVDQVAIQKDGKLIVTGLMLLPGNAIPKKIIRLHSDGSIDNSFELKINDIISISQVVLQEDGKIVVLGVFGRTFSTQVLRFNEDGSPDNSFAAGNMERTNPRSTKVALQNDKIIVAGNFQTYNSIPARGAVRLHPDGTIDDSFNISSGADSEVMALHVQKDKIILGGRFNFFDDKPVNKLVRLNNDGTVDDSFQPDIDFGLFGNVDRIISRGEQLFIAGAAYSIDFNTFLGSLTVLSTNGSKDASFAFEAFDITYYWSTLSIDAKGDILVGGEFRQTNGATPGNESGLLRLDASGKRMANVPILYSAASAYEIKQLGDEKVLIGGDFNFYNDVPANNLVRLNKDGSVDNTFTYPFPVGYADNKVNVITIQKDGKLLVGRHYNSFNGATQHPLIRLHADGSVDNSFQFHFYGSISAVAVQSDGKILVGGYMLDPIKWTFMYLLRLNTDGTIDNTFNMGTGPDRDVNIISVQEDNKIFISGYFTQFNGVNSFSAARLNSDGSLDEGFNLGTGFQGSSVIAVTNDGNKLLIAGYFKDVNGTPTNGFVRVLKDGSIDPTFNPEATPPIIINTIVPTKEGKILLGGSLDFRTGSASSKQMLLLNEDGSIDDSFVQPALDGTIYRLLLKDDGNILAGGSFIHAQDPLRLGLAQILHASSLVTAPTDLSAIALSASQVALKWTDNSTNETGFEIQRALAGSELFSIVATVVSDKISYSDTGVDAGMTYQYKVRALSSGIPSEFSNITTIALPKKDQTITFADIPDKRFGDLPFELAATASSGLPVYLQVMSGPATINGSVVTLTGKGTVVVRATQPGNIHYNAATAVEKSFKVKAAQLSVVKLMLVNADTDQDIQELKDGDVLDLNGLPTQNLNIRAITNPFIVGSVFFKFNKQSVCENLFPYAIGGDVLGDYNPWTLPVGEHKLSVTPYSFFGASGHKGLSYNIRFTVKGMAVTKLILVNADTDKDIMEIKEGALIDMAKLSTRNLNIRAVVSPENVGSVLFNINGSVVVENLAPYAIGGNNSNDYKPYTLPLGSHSLTVTPYTYYTPYANTSGNGAKGIAKTVQFSVIHTDTKSRISAEDEPSVEMKLTAFPNPAYDKTSIHLYPSISTDARIDIYDSRGVSIVCIYNGKVRADAQSLVFDFDTKNLPSGTYLIRLSTQQGVYFHKLVIIK
jgi:uncharacterized delta-60 repeat protein